MTRKLFWVRFYTSDPRPVLGNRLFPDRFFTTGQTTSHVAPYVICVWVEALNDGFIWSALSDAALYPDLVPDFIEDVEEGWKPSNRFPNAEIFDATFCPETSFTDYLTKQGAVFNAVEQRIIETIEAAKPVSEVEPVAEPKQFLEITIHIKAQSRLHLLDALDEVKQDLEDPIATASWETNKDYKYHFDIIRTNNSDLQQG